MSRRSIKRWPSYPQRRFVENRAQSLRPHCPGLPAYKRTALNRQTRLGRQSNILGGNLTASLSMRFLFLVATVSPTAACTPAPPCAIDQSHVDQHKGNASCFIESNGRALVTWVRFSGRLVFPGGTARKNETAQCTAHRETWEETGLDVTVGHLWTRSDGPTIYIYKCAATPSISAETIPILPWRSRIEVSDIQWVDLTELQPPEWQYPRQLQHIQRLLSE